jgi:hypothetical protein
MRLSKKNSKQGQSYENMRLMARFITAIARNGSILKVKTQAWESNF